MDITLPYVTVRINADGAKRYYYQRRGFPLVRLPNDPTSEEFMAAYRVAPDAKKPGRYRRGSLAWCFDQYLDSIGFQTLKPSTRTARKRVIASMLAERINPNHPSLFAALPITTARRQHIKVLRDRKAATPAAANERLKILGCLWAYAMEEEWVDTNVVRDVPRIRSASTGHATATDEDIDRYMAHHTSDMARLIMRLLMMTGARCSDLRRFGKANVKDGALVYTTVKTGVTCEVPIPPDIQADLDRCADMVFALTGNGKPFASDKALSARIAKNFRQAGIEGITAHSVRKWAVTKNAEDGWSEMELCAKYGWRDPKEARPYVQAANRRKLVQNATNRNVVSLPNGRAMSTERKQNG